MADYQTSFQTAKIDPSVYLAKGAVIVGDVRIGRLSSVWFNAVVRGDCEAISIGDATNVQDGCVLHADPGVPCQLGNRVTLGHGAIVHGAQVADDVLIGMRAVIMNRATIGSGSIIGVGAVVTEDSKIPPNSLVLGIPGAVVRQTTDDERAQIQLAAEHYVAAAKAFSNGDVD